MQYLMFHYRYQTILSNVKWLIHNNLGDEPTLHHIYPKITVIHFKSIILFNFLRETKRAVIICMTPNQNSKRKMIISRKSLIKLKMQP